MVLMVVAMSAHDPTRTCEAAMRLSTGPGVYCLTLVSMAYSAMLGNCYFGSMNLTKRRRKMGPILAIGMAFILTEPRMPFAAKKKTTPGRDTPPESINLTYTKKKNINTETQTTNL